MVEIVASSPTTIGRDSRRIAVPECLVRLLRLGAVALDVDEGLVAPAHLNAYIGILGELPEDFKRLGVAGRPSLPVVAERSFCPSA